MWICFSKEGRQRSEYCFSSLWHNTDCMIRVQRRTGRVWCGVDNISVIESEIVKLKAGAVRQQITTGTLVLDITVCSNVEFNGGSSSWKIDTSIFFTTTQNYLLSIQYRVAERGAGQHGGSLSVTCSRIIQDLHLKWEIFGSQIHCQHHYSLST